MEHAGVVDDGVHLPEPVHVGSDTADLVRVGQVANNAIRTAVQQILDGNQAFRTAGMYDDVVALLHKRFGCVPTQPVRRACDKYARHWSSSSCIQVCTKG
ncbi:hypothetical protein GCM10011577_19310 [Pseudarthrobacter polychromogenes]|uniref:Uncharacterized protein n=1 Tax=Pseudarthrobacter polychromogenes TaxID=1676 RepID=A0ABQ1XKM7_9MICC|nr:hypothetical protein GCM10011577_19310 [Pseudarthrobacter polychromogenes]